MQRRGDDGGLRLPPWALHLVLDLLEATHDPLSSDEWLPVWRAAGALCSLSRTYRALLEELVIRDMRILDTGLYGTDPRVVDVSESQDYMTGLRRLASNRLRFVRIEHANLTGSLEPLSRAFKLRHLSLVGCDLLASSLEPLAALTNLHHLNLSGCIRIRGDLKPLSKLVDLRLLHLAWCDLRGDIWPLAALRHLRYLDLDWCSHLRGSLANVFGGSQDADDDQARAAQYPAENSRPPLVYVSVYRASKLSGTLKLRALFPCAQIYDGT